MSVAQFTVIGGAGFVGSHLVAELERRGHGCWAPARGHQLAGRDLGHVVYCAGVTGDWRGRRHEMVDAHVTTVAELTGQARFESLLYLSSTRVYDRHPHAPATEHDPLCLAPGDSEDLYAVSKAGGEAIVLAAGGRVARLSHVYGARMEEHGFLATVVRAAAAGRIVLESSLDSTRDFVSVRDVVSVLVSIALEGRERIYNVVSGVEVTNAELTDELARLTGCEREVRPQAPVRRPPQVDIERIRREFGFAPAGVLQELPALVAAQTQAPA